jgi:hypothetical protein
VTYVTSVLIFRLRMSFFWYQIFLVLVGILVNIAIVNPYFIILMIVLGFCYYGVTIVYLKTSRNVKRLEAISKSFLYFQTHRQLTNSLILYQVQTNIVAFWLMTNLKGVTTQKITIEPSLLGKPKVLLSSISWKLN